MNAAASIEGLLRDLAPRVLGAVVRRYGHFADAEDAVQEALLAAATTWPTDGEPDNPLGWLIRVAARRMADQSAATTPAAAGRNWLPRGRFPALTRRRNATTR